MINLDTFLKESCKAKQYELNEFNGHFENQSLEDIIVFAFNVIRDKRLETREPYKVVRSDGRIIALGLAEDQEEAKRLVSKISITPKIDYTIMPITRHEYNNYLVSLDYFTWSSFGV